MFTRQPNVTRVCRNDYETPIQSSTFTVWQSFFIQSSPKAVLVVDIFMVPNSITACSGIIYTAKIYLCPFP